jgi:hypothetical protein
MKNKNNKDRRHSMNASPKNTGPPAKSPVKHQTGTRARHYKNLQSNKRSRLMKTFKSALMCLMEAEKYRPVQLFKYVD